MRYILSALILLVAVASSGEEPVRPFAPLDASERAKLDTLLDDWEKQSTETKTFACDFQLWQFDLLAAPKRVHSAKESGHLLFAAPDRAVYRVDEKFMYNGMKQGQPLYRQLPNERGEFWIVNGPSIINIDRVDKRIVIYDFATTDAAASIGRNFLPLVFQIKANALKERFWIRKIDPPAGDLVSLEAWPKSKADQARWQRIQVTLKEDDLLPRALVLYPPNFGPQNLTYWHYEFQKVTRNSPEHQSSEFNKEFKRERPPLDWLIRRESWQ